MQENGKYEVAYFREFESTGQCELNFVLNTDLPNYGVFKEEIKAVRQRSDSVQSLLQHIQNKIQKLLQDKLEVRDDKGNQIVEKPDFNILLTRGEKSVKSNTCLKNLQQTTNKNESIMFYIFNQKFIIVFNAPLVKEIILPPVLYATYSVQPVKFNTVFTNNRNSLFHWYKSTDNNNWHNVGKGFVYLIKKDDINHYLKLVCQPLNDVKLQGPAFEVTSETKVEAMGNLPSCPFEKRHEFTRKKLKGSEFRVVSYNILSERYTNDSESYAYCPPKVLAIDYRKQLILKELLGYNADIICLQEVDNRHYTNYFMEKFKEVGYGTIYHRKGNRIPEGLACFYNKSRYKILVSKHIVLSTEIQRHKMLSYIWDVIKKNGDVRDLLLKQSTSLQVTILKTKENNKVLIVGNTHLYYHPDANHIRLLQINIATTYLNMLKRRYLREGENVSVIFCGDFNSSAEKSLFPFMIRGTINPDHEDCIKINEHGKALLYHEFIFESACGTPKFTNYTPSFKGCLDYIFIETNKIEILQVVPLTDEEDLSKHEGLPNELFPSDHLALAVDLKFKLI